MKLNIFESLNYHGVAINEIDEKVIVITSSNTSTRHDLKLLSDIMRNKWAESIKISNKLKSVHLTITYANDNMMNVLKLNKTHLFSLATKRDVSVEESFTKMVLSFEKNIKSNDLLMIVYCWVNDLELNDVASIFSKLITNLN